MQVEEGNGLKTSLQRPRKECFFVLFMSDSDYRYNEGNECSVSSRTFHNACFKVR